MTSRLRKRDLAVFIYLFAFTTVLIGADLTYFNALSSDGEPPMQAGAACSLDSEKGPVQDNGATLIDFQDVTRGPSDASVTIIEYFDPNCPHCKDFHETMKQLRSEYGDEVRFVYKPFPLRGSAMPEIKALYAAQQEGKFFEMLEAQYARQGRSGISKQDLQDIAAEIGMNPDVLMSRIDQDKYREKILQQRQKAIEVGVDSTPTILVNGHFVSTRSLDCMKVFIERAKKGKLGQSTSR